MLNSCAPFSRLTDIAYSRRLEELYLVKPCETMTDKMDELFVVILANYFTPSDDLTKRMVELGVCANPGCSYANRIVAHCDIPIFAKLEAMIVAGCNSVFNQSGQGGSSGTGNSYPTKAVNYTSPSDNNVSFIIAATIGKRVITITRALSPLGDNWLHTPLTGRIDITNGIVGLSSGETITILYEDIP